MISQLSKVLCYRDFINYNFRVFYVFWCTQTISSQSFLIKNKWYLSYSVFLSWLAIYSFIIYHIQFDEIFLCLIVHKIMNQFMHIDLKGGGLNPPPPPVTEDMLYIFLSTITIFSNYTYISYKFKYQVKRKIIRCKSILNGPNRRIGWQCILFD